MMKKRIAAVLCAAVMVLALPTMAFAAPSQQNTQASATSGSVSGAATFNGTVTIVPTSAQASNVALTGSETALASFEINAEGVSETNPLTLSFNVGSQYANATAKVWADHGTNGTEVKTVTVSSDGTVTSQFTKNSVFTVSVDPTTAKPATAANSSSKSPVTGLDTMAIAGITAIAVAGAAGAAWTLRKKTNE